MNRTTWLILAISLPLFPAASQVQPQDAGAFSLDSLLNMKTSTASKHWETTSEAPASVTVVLSDDIQKFGFKTLADVLSSVRSFYMSNDRNYTYLGVRGFSRPTDYNDRILLLLNGHKMNEGFSGTSPFGTDFALDMNSVDRVEIVRGPGSALYGSGALFAVVNVITRSGRAFDHTRVSVEGGSFGTARGSLLAGKEFSNGVDALLSAQWSHATGQNLYFGEFDAGTTNGGIAQRLDWDRSYGLFSSVTYKQWSAQGMLSLREKGIPTGSFGTLFNDPRAQTLDRYGLIDVAFQDDIAHDKHLLVRGYFDHYYYTGAYPYDILNQDETTAQRFGGEVQLRWDLSPGDRVIGGIEYTRFPRADYRSWDETKTYFDNNFPYSLFSLYLENEYQVTSSLSLTLGVRGDAYSTTGNSITPRGGVVFHPGQETTLKLLYGQAFRTPNQYESNYQDPLSNFKVNQSLVPEKIQTTEVILEQRVLDELFGTVSLYENRIDGLIDQVIDPVDSMLHFQNIGRARAIGAEVELTARLRSGLTGYVSYARQAAKDAATGSLLTNSPSDLVKAGISYAPVEYVQTALDANYETGRGTVQGTTTDPFFLANLRLALRAPGNRSTSGPGWLGKLQLSVLVRNLFNAHYETPGGFEHRQAAILQDQRNYLFSLTLTL